MRRPWHEHLTPFEWRWLMDARPVDDVRRAHGHATERNKLSHDTQYGRLWRESLL